MLPHFGHVAFSSNAFILSFLFQVMLYRLLRPLARRQERTRHKSQTASPTQTDQ
jgi:hypothetical protein